VERIIRLNLDSLNGDHSFMILLKFMEENITQPLRVFDFCQATHLSESSVNRLSHEHTGMTAIRLFRKIQCWETDRLLIETSLTIQEISKRMGFKSSKSFSTMYRRNEGVSLMEKRKELGGRNSRKRR
ncbi:helix-turn-helix domain-containing protein, partial [Enterococcus sp. 12E11_DIV0728]